MIDGTLPMRHGLNKLRDRWIAAAAAFAITTTLGTAAPGAVYTFTNPDGGEYNVGANWSGGVVPAAQDTVYFGDNLAGDVVSFTTSGVAKNLDGDAGSYTLNFELGGNTWTLGTTQNQVRGSYNLTSNVPGAIVYSSHSFAIHSGATLTVGPDVTVKASGSPGDQLVVHDGGTIRIQGGRYEARTGERDLRVYSGGVAELAGAGSMRHRYMYLRPGSTTRFILNNNWATTYSGSYPMSSSDLREVTGDGALGNLEIQLAPGFSAAANDEFKLIQLTYVPSNGKGFNNLKFTNLPANGSTISAGGYTFQAAYTNTTLKLVVTDVPSPHPDNELFIFSGGHDSDSWHTSANWSSGYVPNSTNTAYFGSGLNGKTIGLASNGEAKNLNGDLGAYDLTFQLNGNTLTLSNQSEIKGRYAFNSSVPGGTVYTQANGYVVHPGAKLIIGNNATVQGRGAVNLVTVHADASLEILGGNLQNSDGKRNIRVEAGGTVRFSGPGAVIARHADMQSASGSHPAAKLHFTLEPADYSTAPFVLDDVIALGDIEFDLSPTFSAPVGTVLHLITLGNADVANHSFANHRFGNLTDGQSITVGNYTFTAAYSDTTLSLTVQSEVAQPPAGTYEFTGGLTTAPADNYWHTAANWSSGWVPDLSNTAYFGEELDGRVITLLDDAYCHLMTGDWGNYVVDFDLNGFMLRVNSHSLIRGEYNFRNTAPSAFDEAHPDRNKVRGGSIYYEIDAGSTMRIHSGVTVTGGSTNNTTGLHYLVNVLGGGLLDIAGGHLGPNTGSRDVHAQQNGTIRFSGGAGTITGRRLHLKSGSTLSFALEADNIGGEAPLRVTEVHELGDLEFQVGSSFDGQPGDEIKLIDIVGSVKDGLEFDTHRFANAPPGTQFTAGGYTFEPVYYRDKVNVVVVAGGTPRIPYHAVEAVVEFNYYTDDVSQAKVIVEVPYGAVPSGYKARAAIGGTAIEAQSDLLVGRTEILLPISALTYGVEYPVEVSIRNGSGVDVWNASSGFRARTLIRRPNVTDRNVVQIDQYNGVMMVRPHGSGSTSSPTFPLGIMNVTHEVFAPGQSQLDEVANAGFNLVMRWKGETIYKHWRLDDGTVDMTSPYPDYNRIEAVREYLDAVDQAGLWAFEAPVKLGRKGKNPSWYVKYGNELTQSEWEALYPTHNNVIAPGVVAHAKDHPAVIGYYGYDEPWNFPGGAQMQVGSEEWYQAVRGADPYHPVMLLFASGISGASDWLAWDVPMRDFYPNADASNLHSVYYNARAGAEDARALGYTFFMTPLLESSSSRPLPLTPGMQQASTYLSLIGDAKGIMYWVWPAMYKPTWDKVKQLAGEINTLKPMLMERTPAYHVHYPAYGTQDHVKVLIKNHNGRTHLLMVNATGADVDVTGQLPSRYTGTAASWFTDTPDLLISGGSFTITPLAPYERRVYELPSASPSLWQHGETLKLTLTKHGDPVLTDPSFVGGSINRVINSSFEYDYGALPGWPYGWDAGDTVQQSGAVGNGPNPGGRWTKDTDTPPGIDSGTYSLRVTKVAPTVDGGSTDIYWLRNPGFWIPNAYPTTNRTGRYVISAYIKAAPGTTAGIHIIRNGSQWLGHRSISDTWTRYSWAYDKSDTSESDNIVIHLMTQGTIWVDAVQIERVGSVGSTVNTPTPYVHEPMN